MVENYEAKENVKDYIKRYRGATIQVVSNGFIIKIGCQTVVAESAESLKKLVSAYLDDPDGTEHKLLKGSFVFNNAVPDTVNPTPYRFTTPLTVAQGIGNTCSAS